MPALDASVEPHCHVIAQVIEAEFGVHPEGDVRLIRFGAVHHAQVLLVFLRSVAFEIDDKRLFAVLGDRRHLQHAHAQAEQMINGRHPARIAPRQVVVDRDHMHAAPEQGVEVHGHGRHERFTLTGAHFHDLAGVEHRAADDLHIVVTQTDRPLGGFAHHCKRFGQDLL